MSRRTTTGPCGGREVRQSEVPLSDECREWLHWRFHARLGFAVLLAQSFAAGGYVLASGTRHAGLLLVLLGGVAGAAFTGLLAAGRIASMHRRGDLLLFAAVTTEAAVGACAHLDGGLQSPLLLFVLLPVLYATLLLGPLAVAVVGAAAGLVIVLIAAADTGVEWLQPNLSIFVALVAGAVVLAVASAWSRCRRDAERAKLEERLLEQARLDPLTQCLNAGEFHRRMKSEVARAEERGQPLTLMVCDVDLFKSFNDTYGHELGDAVLVTVADRLRALLRSEDVLGRIGGDEFALVLPGRRVDEVSRAAADLTVSVGDTATPPTLSAGIAQLGLACPTASSLFHAADSALFDAKGAGRARIGIAGEPLPPAPEVDMSANGRRTEERARRERRQRLQTETMLDLVLADSPVGFALVDPELRVLRAKGASLEPGACPGEHIVGQRVPDVLPTLEPLFREVLRSGQAVRNVEVTHAELRGEAPAKANVVTLTPVHLGGSLVGIGTVSVDITERKLLGQSQMALVNAVVRTFAAATELRDPYTAGHQRRVGEIALSIARTLGLDEDTAQGIRIGGELHDVGKIAVPAEILAKPGRLTRAEFLLVQQHPKAGHDILRDIPGPWPIADMVMQHHERFDGSGYPSGLRGEQICLGARIIAVADVLEAVASHRPYRPALGRDAALSIIERGSGSEFDPVVVRAAADLVRDGSVVLEGAVVPA